MKIIFVQYCVALSFMNNMCHLHFYFDPNENIDNRISYLHRNPCNNIIVTKSNDIMSLIGIPKSQLMRHVIVSIYLISRNYPYSNSILSELHIDITKMTRAAKLSSHSCKANQCVNKGKQHIIGYITLGQTSQFENKVQIRLTIVISIQLVRILFKSF